MLAACAACLALLAASLTRFCSMILSAMAWISASSALSSLTLAENRFELVIQFYQALAANIRGIYTQIIKNFTTHIAKIHDWYINFRQQLNYISCS